MKRLCFLLLVITIAHSAIGQSNADRYALVIGVKDYVHVAPLRNSVNDAQDMAVVLRNKGFTVQELYNPKTKRDLQEAIRAYYEKIKGKKDATGVVFYSGHSVQIKGINYFMPTNSNPQIEADLDDQALKMEYLLGAIEQAGNQLNVFILDACRNNPFRGFTRSTEQGLNQVSAPKGSYVVYATAPGSVASDGTGRNGLFTSKLLKYINTPSISLEQVFKYVARDVQQESEGNQVPWINYSYFGDFSFDLSAPKPQSHLAEKSVATPPVSETNKYSLQEMYDKANELINHNDTSAALGWYTKAADGGFAGAQYKLGVMYYEAEGVAKDFIKAERLYRKAAEQGHAEAQNYLGYMYKKGSGVTKNYQEAVKWFRKAADQQNASAQCNMGDMYYDGWGVPQNYNEALTWYRKAADQGHSAAQSNIGFMHDKGVGVPQNSAEAVNWYRKSAEQGNVVAQSNLGYMYSMGKGTEINYTEAAYWFRKAADKGNNYAQNNLAILYQNGNGVPKNIMEAINLFKKAAAQGNKDAIASLRELGINEY